MIPSEESKVLTLCRARSSIHSSYATDNLLGNKAPPFEAVSQCHCEEPQATKQSRNVSKLRGLRNSPCGLFAPKDVDSIGPL
jgi:hypothetical protein